MTITQRESLTIVSIWVGSNRILTGSLKVADGIKLSGGSNLYPLVLNSWPISVYDNKRVTSFLVVDKHLKLTLHTNMLTQKPFYAGWTEHWHLCCICTDMYS